MSWHHQLTGRRIQIFVPMIDIRLYSYSFYCLMTHGQQRKHWIWVFTPSASFNHKADRKERKHTIVLECTNAGREALGWTNSIMEYIWCVQNSLLLKCSLLLWTYVKKKKKKSHIEWMTFTSLVDEMSGKPVVYRLGDADLRFRRQDRGRITYSQDTSPILFIFVIH